VIVINEAVHCPIIFQSSTPILKYLPSTSVIVSCTVNFVFTLSGKVVCLCTCEDRGASPSLTVFVNFQILSTIIHRLSSINSWLITRWSYQQFVDKSKSLSAIHIRDEKLQMHSSEFLE
jgi:hypothetical protein